MTSLIEREAELGAGTEMLESARVGRGSVLLLEGPAGIGKSSVLTALCDVAREEGLRVLAARGSELEREFGFGGALQLLEPPIEELSPEQRDAVFVGAATLGRPLLGDRRNLDRQKGAATEDFALIHGLFWVLSTLAERAPLVIALDDAQWADAPTLRFLLYLAQRVSDLPVALLMTRRDSEPLTDPALDRFFGRPNVPAVRLAPLSVAGTQRVIEATLPGPQQEFVAACQELTGGNPFLLHELLHELAVGGVRPDAAAALAIGGLAPRSVSLATLTRIARLPSPSSALARAVAVLGDGCSLAVAAGITGMDLDHAGRVADSLTAAEIFAPGAPVGFAHPLVRTAVYEDIPHHQRAGMHLKGARLLRERSAPADRIASHLMLAPPGGGEWVVDVLREAAELSTRHGAPDVTVARLSRALDEGTDARADVLVELANAEARLGLPYGPARLEEALRLVGEPSRRVEIHHCLGRLLHEAGRFGEAAQAFERGLEEMNGEGGEHVRGQLEAGYIGAARIDVSTRPAALERLTALRERGGVPSGPLERMLFATMAFEGAMSGEPHAEVAALARRALERGPGGVDSGDDWIGFYSAVSALGYTDELEEAESLLTGAVIEARRRGSVVGLARASGFRAFANYRLGRLVDAIADARAALEHSAGANVGGPAINAVLARALIDRGKHEEAGRALEVDDLDAWSTTAPYAYYLEARGHLRLHHGERQGALADLLACGRLLDDLQAPNPSVIPWRSAAAVASAAGSNGDARDLVERELELAQRFGAQRAIGVALRARGVVERDIDSLHQAVDALSSCAAPLERARALIDLGTMLRVSGKRREARDHLQEGLDLARRCRATALAARAMEEARAAGARPRREPLRGVDSLTASERRVAAMAAEGMTNRQIAEALFVTVKAVQWHLGNVYRKLELSSRKELPGALEEAE